MSDLYRLAQGLAPQPSPIRARFGVVVSVEADRTCTVSVGGADDTVPGVRYLAGVTPLPGAPVMLLTDGVDLVVVDHPAAAGRTLAVRTSRADSQTIATATNVAVIFDTASNDEWGCWAAGQPTRLAAPLAGRYIATATATFASDASGSRSVWIERDGGVTLARSQTPPASGLPAWLNVTTVPFLMDQGNYIEMMVRQNSGGDLSLNSSGLYSPALGLTYLGP